MKSERTTYSPLVAVADAFFGLTATIVIVAELLLLYALVSAPSPWLLAALCLVPYLYPLLLFRALELVRPVREGRFVLRKGEFSPWVAAYRIQRIFVLLPFLESILLAIPGAYSLWLRAWGSRIGRGVIWAGNVTVTDRSLVEIGDDVLVGNLVYLSPHVVNPMRTHLLLVLKRIRIGGETFVGAGCRLGPGATVDERSFVPILTDLYLNERFPAPHTNGGVHG